MKTLTVYYPGILPSPYKNLLRSSLADGILFKDGNTIPADFDILIEGKPTAQLLHASTKLKALVIPYAGVPEATRALMLQLPEVKVYNIHHNAQAVAEYTLALLLAAVKNIIPMHNALKSGDWTPRYLPSQYGLLRGGKALILGYGAIGREVASLLTPFGVTIHAIKQNLDSRDEMDDLATLHGLADLHTLLPATDFLIVTLPLTPHTKGLIATAELSLLPAHAFIVNVGRGEVIDQHALYASLHSRRIAGAAIDVWYHYPGDEESRTFTYPADEPFGDLDNIIMSPHKAGGLAVAQVESLRMHFLADLLNHIYRQQEFPPGIDLNKGY